MQTHLPKSAAKSTSRRHNSGALSLVLLGQSAAPTRPSPTRRWHQTFNQVSKLDPPTPPNRCPVAVPTDVARCFATFRLHRPVIPAYRRNWVRNKAQGSLAIVPGIFLPAIRLQPRRATRASFLRPRAAQLSTRAPRFAPWHAIFDWFEGPSLTSGGTTHCTVYLDNNFQALSKLARESQWHSFRFRASASDLLRYRSCRRPSSPRVSLLVLGDMNSQFIEEEVNSSATHPGNVVLVVPYECMRSPGASHGRRCAPRFQTYTTELSIRVLLTAECHCSLKPLPSSSTPTVFV